MASRSTWASPWLANRAAALLVAVRAPAVSGAANVALRRALAEALGIRTPDVAIVRGERARDKVVEIDPAPAAAGRWLSELY